MALENKISTLVQNQFPDFYKEDGENFLLFIQAYYEYLEQNGKLTEGIQNLQSYKDIDTTLDEYVEYFRTTLLPSIPTTALADKRLLAKAIKFFNQSRGTLSSYKLLFRSLYNEEVDVTYPADSILKVSDGDWRIDRYLVTAYDYNTYRFIGRTIRGTESEAEALVEDVVRRTINGRDLMQIYVSNIKGTFSNLEPIQLKGTTSPSPHAPIIEAGISGFTIVSPGAEYQVGDKIDLISTSVGKFGKAVVTNVDNLGGSITFEVTDGGSGYSPSTEANGSEITITGGDGTQPASFTIDTDDIGSTFDIRFNTNKLNSNTLFGSLAPTIGSLKSYNFANTVLSSPDFGFQESTTDTSVNNFRDHMYAKLVVANTSDPNITVGSSLFGVTSGANCTVNAIARAYNSTDVVLTVHGYKNFSPTEKVNISTSTGATVGTVAASGFYGNTIGGHLLNLSVSGSVSVGDELRGGTSNSFGIVKNKSVVGSNTYLYVTANTTANLTSQFDTGGLKPFSSSETVYEVGTGTTIGTVNQTSSNTLVENIHTKLSDSLLFKNKTVGSILQLSLPVGGANYSIAPTVSVRDDDIASLGIGEAYITLQSDDENWATGNSVFTKLDTTDKLYQSSTGAKGYVKGGATGSGISVSQYANGTYEMTVRVWQEVHQRKPGSINWANNATVSLQAINGEFLGLGEEADTRTPVSTGTAKIVSVRDEGVLGENAVITPTVGADGTIVSLKAIDSGFGYKNRELVTLAQPERSGSAAGQVRINLSSVANAEGYYASTRSHVSSKRGYLQDGVRYQEFSYEVGSAISLDRYRDIALKLVHPAGQGLFANFKISSNVKVDVSATSLNVKRLQGNGTISINNGSYDLTGSSTTLTSEFANNDTIIIEYAHGEFYKIPLNIVSDATTANVKIAWANSNLSSANVYYESGSI